MYTLLCTTHTHTHTHAHSDRLPRLQQYIVLNNAQLTRKYILYSIRLRRIYVRSEPIVFLYLTIILRTLYSYV